METQGASEEYKAQYEIIFQGDVEFSRKLMPKVRRILDGIEFCDRIIRNNENTPLDFQGSDLTIVPPPPIHIGVRVRRYDAIKWDQFTQDDKERNTMSCDVYFLGYATEDEKRLFSYMVWSGKDFQENRDNGTIPMADRCRNNKHSMVYFNCYNNHDIAQHCKVYAMRGHIAWRRNPNKARFLQVYYGAEVGQ